QLKATVAALLEEKPNAETKAIRNALWNGRPYWDLERCRVGETRKVPVEVVVNGRPVARQEVEADGQERGGTFGVPGKRAGWGGRRVLPSSHTNPVFVLVDNKPIRASKKSAEWCLQAVEQCWKQKVRQIRPAERAAARAAYDHALAEYKRILGECAGD